MLQFLLIIGLPEVHTNTYLPSESELMWQGEITHKICDIASNPRQIQLMKLALKGEAQYMSLMGNGTRIEPLTGIGRHPFAKVGCPEIGETSIFDISYLNISNFCKTPNPTFTAFIDMGCADYNRRQSYASGRGSSIPLFESLYQKSCVTFDRIYAWEAHPYPNWWSNVPVKDRDRIEFHNFKVDADQVRTLLQKFQPSDFVVVKLDIDHVNTEISILNVLEQHAHLIDELFFEYHYYFDGLNFGWGHKLNSLKHNATSAMRTMSRLRQKGIRAHFWI